MIAGTILKIVRFYLSLLQTTSVRVGLIWKIFLAIVMVPPFGFLLLVLRIRLHFKGPFTIEGKTSFGAIINCQLPDLIQMYIYLFGFWEPDLTDFIDRRLSEGDTFIDVGANVGYYTFLASSCVGDSGRIVAIEASPEICEKLKENISKNGTSSSIRVIAKAVSDSCCTLDMYQGPGHNVGMTSTVEHRGLKRTGEVEAAPLSDLLEDDETANARLIKIDVEGVEDRVLAGMGDMLEKLRDDVEILVELSPEWWKDTSLTPAKVLQPMIDAGFNVYTIKNNYWPWRYLWPECVSRPQRMKERLHKRVKRIDIILSRVDADEL